MSEFHQVRVLHGGRIVRVWRSDRCFASADELLRERARLVAQLDAIGRCARALLIDSRLAPHSTETQWGEEFQRYRRDVLFGYQRVASLVRTKAAILQVNRLCRGQATAFQVFNDEGAAVEYLLRGGPSRHVARAPL